MRRFSTMAFATVGLILGAGTTVLFAGDPPSPPPAPSGQASEIEQRVEDLGSADFRVREAAWKALVGFGEKARPALEAAQKSENASVRFRSEQLLARLNGGTKERPLDDGTPSPTNPAPGAKEGTPRGGFGPRGFGDDEFERLMRETQERMKNLEEQLRREFGNAGPAFGPQWFGPTDRNSLWRWNSRAASGSRVQVDGGDLVVSPAGAARLQLTEKAGNGVSMSTVYEGRSLDAIFEAYPDLKARPVVAELLEKKAAEDAARAEREKAARERGGMLKGGVFSNKTVMVQSQDGRTTVTITETGPDGKQVTKTYEGADMESIKRDHPEIGDALGGIRIELGGGNGVRPGTERPFEPMPGDLDGDLPDGAETGPFGLGLGRVDDALRQHLNLEAGKGSVVVAVRPGSRADRIGLQARDVILAVNGTAVDGPEKVAELVRAAGEAGALSIDVNRAGKPLTLRR